MTDFHTHAFPDAIAAKTIPMLAAVAGLTPTHNGTAADLIRIEREAGIDRAVVLPVVTKPSQFESVNRFAAELDRTPGLRAFGGMHPDCEEPEEKLRLLREQGVRGIKIHPDYQGAFIDDPRYVRLIRAALALDLYVVTHAGFDPVSPEAVHCPPDRAARMLDLVYDEPPAVPRIIFAHMGGVGMQKEFAAWLLGKPVYIDTSFVLPDLDPLAAAALIRAHGTDKVLFATDAPWGDPKVFLSAFDRLPLTAAEREAVLEGNAAKILG